MTVVNYYELLGIDPSSDADAIRAAVRKTRGRYRQQAGSPSLEQRSKAERVIAQIAEAEQAFESAESRRAYDARLAAQREAEQTATSSARPEPESSESGPRPNKDWLASAKQYLEAGEVHSAAGAAKEATRAAPGDAEAWQVRARASLQQKDFHDAEFAATEAMKLLPGSGAGAGIRGDVLRAEGRYSEAEDAYRNAADLEPTSSHWPVQVAFTLLDQDLPKDAVVQARDVVVRFAGEQYARDALARVLVADSEAAMSNDENGGVHVASKKQIAHIEARIVEIGTLEPVSDWVGAYRDGLRGRLQEAHTRRFQAPSGKLLLWVLGWIFIGSWLSWEILTAVLGGFLGVVVALAVNVGLAAALFLRVFPEQWQLNRKMLGAWVRTGLQ